VKASARPVEPAVGDDEQNERQVPEHPEHKKGQLGAKGDNRAERDEPVN